MFKTIPIVIVGLFVCLFAFKQIDPNVPKENDVQQSADEQGEAVTIEGEIVMPGIYKMGIDAILSDLISEAGGLLESADKNAINLSLEIGSRDYFYIPAKTAYANNCEITAEVEKININTATEEELDTLSQIGPETAKKIITYREENGPFECIEDLMNVSEIGQATYERIRDYVTLK